MAGLRKRTQELLEQGRQDDPASRHVDLILITLIALNVLSTILESVREIEIVFGEFFGTFERISVAIFTAEYVLRMWSCVDGSDPRFSDPVKGRLRYAVSPMALIDLLAVAPFFLAAFVSVDLRFLRVLRILRILKLSHYFSVLNVLLDALREERKAFGAALFLMTIAVLFAASGIYLVEHEAQPAAFSSIPSAMWWSVVTLTTVGYGDVSPVTPAGKFFGAAISVLGVGMVALPTAILAHGFTRELRRREATYRAEVDVALEDGVIDPVEWTHLERLRKELGLDEEDVDARDPRAVLGASCPHCGKDL